MEVPLGYFKGAQRKNYSIEAAMLLLQQKFLLSPRKSAQLTYSRFVNTNGRTGCNIPCDLHMEHLNRRLKEMIKNLGSNIQPNTIKRAGESLDLIHHICSVFKEETKMIKKDTNSHKTPSFVKDLNQILNVLEEASKDQRKASKLIRN